MERPCHLERNDPPRTELPAALDEHRDVVGATGQHHLTGRVDVGHPQTPAVGPNRLGDQSGGLGVDPEKRRHRRRFRIRRFVHGAPRAATSDRASR